ncbi:MAG: hypothetical protein H0U08_11630 [Actinobacteria bacterium]|nr:hypothetical protein [Actinomycetota bacterium]
MKEERQRPRSGRLQGFLRDRNPPERTPVLRQQATKLGGQGEALATWVFWCLVTLAVLVTYSRLEPVELYHTSEDGVRGGLGRALVLLNFPVALVAVAITLVAVAALSRAAWWAAAPGIALCAVVPAVVDQDDLDAKWGNALPALGVLIAFALTLAATRLVEVAFAPRRPGDPARLVAGVVVLALSLPWIAAEVGFHFPGDVFRGEELYPEKDGTVIASVHLGHHHGMDGALLVLTSLLLSRVRVAEARLRFALAAYLGLMLAYGAVNFAQDLWFEQVVKRGWTDASIPAALLPGLRPIWAVVVVLAALATLVLVRENDRVETAQPA